MRFYCVLAAKFRAFRTGKKLRMSNNRSRRSFCVLRVAVGRGAEIRVAARESEVAAPNVERNVGAENGRHSPRKLAFEKRKLLFRNFVCGVVYKHEVHAARLHRVSVGIFARVERRELFNPPAAEFGLGNVGAAALEMPVVVARDVAARNFGIRHAFGELFDVAFRRKVDDVAAENREFAAALFRAFKRHRESLHFRLACERPVHAVGVVEVRLDKPVGVRNVGVGNKHDFRLFRALDVQRDVVARLSERARAGLFFSVCAAAFPPKNAAARVAAVFARVLLFIGKIFFFPRLEIRQR